MEELLELVGNFFEAFFSKYGILLIALALAVILKLVFGRTKDRVPKKLMRGDYGYHPERDAPLKVLSVTPYMSYFMYALGIIMIAGGLFLVGIVLEDQEAMEAGAVIYVVFGLVLALAVGCFFIGLWIARTRVYYNGEQIFIQKGNGSFDTFSWREVAGIERIQGGVLLKDSAGKIRVRAGERQVGYAEFLQQVNRAGYEKSRSME